MSNEKHTSKVNENDLLGVSDITRARSERGARIKSLRESLQLTVVDFAALMHVTKQTQLKYEKGATAPDADYLAELYFQFAVDLGPLITGAPRSKPMKVTADVEEMLRRYEALPATARRTVDEVVSFAWQAQQNKR
ncbi:helix-turn-helix domain-containing protein [Delftia sp. WSY_4]|uniref:helix-turn-helix domain-containing protein n=1 Tax=unclassified Delftia TaxID=2613839 RepID=UPI00370B47C8